MPLPAVESTKKKMLFIIIYNLGNTKNSFNFHSIKNLKNVPL